MKFALPLGSSDIGLRLAKSVKLAAPSTGKPGGGRPGLGRYAGLAAIDVAKPGKLDVVLSTATYVDLVRDGAALKTESFGMTKGCAGIRKAVTYAVTPGRYVVQLTGSPTQRVKMGLILR